MVSSRSAHTTRPGIVRGFWWRTNQPARLAITCLGLLAVLATTGAAGFLGDAGSPEAENARPEAAVHRGDAFEVTVHTVSDVDSFEGVEPATGLLLHAQVAGLRRSADCWLAESRAAAQNLLLGKKVRLTVKKDGVSGGDRIAVDVQLPDGSDYAQTVVRNGAAAVDVSARDELAPVESVARQENRGLWASSCVVTLVTVTSSSVPSSPAPTTTTTTTVTTTESSTKHPPPVTTTSQPADNSWLDARLGKFCFREGARRTGPNGEEIVCARNGKNQLRWRRAD